MASVPRLAMGSLFPCLPDEIGLECLVRVELNSHRNLRCVCRSWNAALKSPLFYGERKRLKLLEQKICMSMNERGGFWGVTIYDMQKRLCKALPPIPAEVTFITGCYFVKQNLVVFPSPVAYRVKPSIWLYDFSCSKWREGAKLPRWRLAFASAADDRLGLIYVAGGFNKFDERERNAAVYTVEEDKWDNLPNMNTCVVCPKGVFADGKFYVIGSTPTFEVFDSHTRSWKTLENRFNSRHFLSVSRRLHCFSSRGLMEYDYSQDKLHILGLLPAEDWDALVNCALVVGDKICLVSLDPVEGVRLYMLAPPSETGGQFKFIGIERPPGLLKGTRVTAATQVDV